MSFEDHKLKPGQGGRVKGSRNRIAYKLIEALERSFEELGDAAIRVCAIERPNEYLRVICSVIPKELEISDNRLKDLSDDELSSVIDHIKQQLAGRTLGLADRTTETLN